MSNPYLKFVGKIMGNFVGVLDHYSEQHKKFLTSGFICANCNETLMKWWGVANVNCLSSETTASLRPLNSNVRFLIE